MSDLPKQTIEEAVAMLDDNPAFKVVIEMIADCREGAIGDIVASSDPYEITRRAGGTGMADSILGVLDPDGRIRKGI